MGRHRGHLALFDRGVCRHNGLMMNGAKRAIRWWQRRGKGARYSLLLAAGIFGAVTVALVTSPVWLTPLLQHEKPFLEKTATSMVGAPVRAAELVATIGWRPGFMARDVVIAGRSKPAIVVKAVRVQLSWFALLRGRLWPAFVGAYGAQLDLRRTPTGFHVIGLPRRPDTLFHWRSLLRKEGTLAIVDGRIGLIWSPHRAASFQHLNVSWVNGIAGRTLQVAATIPTLCRRCAATIEFDNRSFQVKKFRGAIGLSVHGLNLHAGAVLAQIPAIRSLAGSVGGRFWTSWQGGRINFAGGNVRLANALVPATGRSRAFSVPQFSAKFSFTRRSQGFRFYGADVTAKLGGVAARTGTLYISKKAARWRVNAESIDLVQAAYLVRHIRHPAPRLVQVMSLHPQGRLLHLRLVLSAGSHWAYQASTRFLGLGVEGSGTDPTFSHASGRLAATNRSGRLDLTGLRGSVHVPTVLASPIWVRSAHAELTWQVADNGFSFELPVFHIATADGLADAALTVIHAHGQSPHVSMTVTLHHVDVGALSHYYPRSLSPHLRRWLTRTIRGGLITSGHVTLNGPLDQFPFRHGGGLFRVDVHVIHGRYRFLPRWPEARHVHATVSERGAILSVLGSGRLGGMVTPMVSVQAGSLGTSTGVASVRLQGKGDLGALLAVILPHVPAHLRRFVPQSLSGQGPARLNLAIRVPFAHKDPLTLQGSVRLSRAVLDYPWTDGAVPIHHLTGTVGFSENGPDTGQLRGAVLGGPFSLTLERHGRGVLAKAHGSVSALGLQRIAGVAAPYVKGPLPWHLQITNGQRFRMTASADLHDVVLYLPYPAGKAQGIPAVAYAHLTADGRGTLFHAGIPHHLSVSYRAPAGLLPASWVGVGSALPPRVLYPGLTVGVRSSYLNANVWARFVAGLSHVSDQAFPGAKSGILAPRALHLYVGSFVLAGRSLGMVRAHFERVGTTWRGAVRGPNVLGTVDWQAHGRPTLLLSFQRLVIPPVAGASHKSRLSEPIDPRGLPAVQFIANSLTVDGRALGRVIVDGAPFSDGFRFGRILIVRHRTTVSGHGLWTLHGGRQESTFVLALHSHNLGVALGDWGLPNQVAGGRTNASAALNWPGGPANFSLGRLNAKVQFSVRRGRFIQVRQGAGKLLGIFNVDSIANYLTLDFSNIFGRGFSFNSIDGGLMVELGVAMTTQAIHVHGASANIAVSGDADLAAQTFNLVLRVSPHIQNNVTLATGLLGGPVAGAAVLLMQKVFANEINESTGTTYLIKGPWSKPVIRKKADKS